MDYRRALHLVFDRANFERQPQPPYAERVYRLDRMRELLEACGNPQHSYPAVHVAGTKGKGSVTAMVESILRAAGLRTGMYTSPHLHTFRERIRIAGEPASEEQICVWMELLEPALSARPEVTVFEAITALAMIGFRESRADAGVFEVGMGGRLDATNVLEPVLAIITPISLDHINVLGNTIEAIAAEKAGIIKPGIPVVSSPQVPAAEHVIRSVCTKRGAPLHYVPEQTSWQLLSADLTSQRFVLHDVQDHSAHHFMLPLLGEHQLENAATAVTAIQLLRTMGWQITDQAVERGLQTVAWLGRLEVLAREPLLVVDGAHNGHSIQRLTEALPAYFAYRKVTLIFGVSSTHTPLELLTQIAPLANRLIVTQSAHSKATPAADLAAHAESLGLAVEHYATVALALNAALEQVQPHELLLVTGSLFVVAEARTAWLAHCGLPPPPGDPGGIY